MGLVMVVAPAPEGAPTVVGAPAGGATTPKGNLGGVDSRPERLGEGDGEDPRGSIEEEACAKPSCLKKKPVGESNNLAQAVLVEGFKACGKPTLEVPFRGTREGLKGLMVVVRVGTEGVAEMKMCVDGQNGVKRLRSLLDGDEDGCRDTECSDDGGFLCVIEWGYCTGTGDDRESVCRR